MKPLIEMIQKGYPPTKDACDREIHAFWNCREELSVIDGVKFKGRSTIVIPASMRHLILEKMNQGHLGMGECKNRVMVTHQCGNHRFDQPVQNLPELQTTAPNGRAWQKVGTDLLSWNSKNYIVVIYYFSNYFEVKCLTTVNSRSVIACLKDICTP